MNADRPAPSPRPPAAAAARWRLLACAALLALAGCATRTDGPGANPPDGLAQLPDAVPRVETLRSGGPNKPYVVLGRRYEPLSSDQPLREQGLASWYGRKFHGRSTSNGETYDMYAMTAAHKTMPLPSYARVRNIANGREVIVRVNDRGPFVDGRVIDLSYAAALRLGVLRGLAPVQVERLTHDEIRAGDWRRAPPGADMETPGPPPAAAAAPAMVPMPMPMPVPVTMHDDPLLSLVAASAGAALAGAAAPGSGFWLQLGAFRERDGAAALLQRVQRQAAWLAPQLVLQGDGDLTRLHAGPWATRDEALGAADRLRDATTLQPLLLDRR